MNAVFRGTALEVHIQPDVFSAGQSAAMLVAQIIRETPDPVLGLVADHSLLPFYRELIRLYREEGLDFSRVTAFNLDGNTGKFTEHPQSCARFMWKHFFRFVNMEPVQVHIPRIPEGSNPAFSAAYGREIEQAGGLDVQVLDIESARQLTYGETVPLFASRADRSRSGTPPYRRIAADTDTVMNARRCIMLASGAVAAPEVAAAVEGPLLTGTPSWILKQHSCAQIFMDESAAEELKLKEYYHWVRTGESVRHEPQAA